MTREEIQDYLDDLVDGSVDAAVCTGPFTYTRGERGADKAKSAMQAILEEFDQLNKKVSDLTNHVEGGKNMNEANKI